MTGQRKRMLVFGRGSESIPHFALTDDAVDVVRAGDVHVPDAVADYVLVAGSEPQQLSDVQASAPSTNSTSHLTSRTANKAADQRSVQTQHSYSKLNFWKSRRRQLLLQRQKTRARKLRSNLEKVRG